MLAQEQEPLLSTQHQTSANEGSRRISRWPKARAFRSATQRFLASKYGHYTVLFMVAVDTIGIFATFLIELFLCEQGCGKASDENQSLHEAQHVLEVVSLVFSCLFMVELMACVFAFGFRYFKSWFHCMDAAVIIIAFVIDVALQGILEEVGSAVVILRLWRVFKIMDEFSAGASEQMETLSERIEELEKENHSLRKRIAHAQMDLED